MPRLKLLITILLFAGLAIAAWQTLTDGTVRAVTLAVIASFAARTYLHHRRTVAGKAHEEWISRRLR